MADVMRIVKDLRAEPQAIRSYPVDLTTVIEIGDLCWLDGNDVKNAAHANLWEATEAATRRKLARKFVGAAQSAHDANDAAVTTVRVAGRGVARYPVGTATTFEFGDLVGGDQDGANNVLLDQSVQKTADPQEAIGRVVEQHTVAASAVLFEFAARDVAGGFYEEDYYEIEANYGGAYAADTLPLGIVRQPGQVVEALFTAHTVPSAAASITIDVRKADNTSLLSAAAVLDPGVLTAAGVNVSLPLNATAANVNVDEGDALKVVFASASGTQGQDWSVKLRVKKNIGR